MNLSANINLGFCSRGV